MLISYSNPKSILFLSAVFSSFLNNSDPTGSQFSIMFFYDCFNRDNNTRYICFHCLAYA
ncbi:LysE family transporter [Marinomonas sp. GJ51-6]|uniref:LysE family transporter n=1 Tax=Marinomonas sp. GJ51-6 TaxID=2992802 RepID=UPI003977280B